MVFDFVSDEVLGFGTICIQPVKYEKDHISIIIIAIYPSYCLSCQKAIFLKINFKSFSRHFQNLSSVI